MIKVTAGLGQTVKALEGLIESSRRSPENDLGMKRMGFCLGIHPGEAAGWGVSQT
jgi:hypothetical protein